MTAVDRARDDIGAGRLWLARQRLGSYLVEHPEDDVIDLLAQVHLAMGDLPAAGALLFVLGRDDAMAQQALAAWRSAHGGPAARWRSIPRPLRHASCRPHVEQLKAEALTDAEARGARSLVDHGSQSRGERMAETGCIVLAMFIAVWAGIVFLWGVIDFVGWVAG